MSHKLQLEMFEGPLDLLLYLIKKNDMDICDIPVADVTEQYMEYIEAMKMLDLDLVGEFLVMAATLIQIKSRMLLPPAPMEEEEVDPRDDLIKRLQEYKVFKEAADQFRTLEMERKDLYSRQVDEEGQKELKESAQEVYFEANLFDLINAFTKTLRRFQEGAVYRVTEEKFTVEEKIHEILHVLVKKQKILLTDLFAKMRSKMEAIVSFMAILELIRLKEIKVMQKRLFADIEVVYNKDNVIPSVGGNDGGT